MKFRNLKGCVLAMGMVFGMSQSAVADMLIQHDFGVGNTNDGFTLNGGGLLWLDMTITEGCVFAEIDNKTCGALAPYNLAGINFRYATIAEVGTMLNAIDTPFAYSETAPTIANTATSSASTDSFNWFDEITPIMGGLTSNQLLDGRVADAPVSGVESGYIIGYELGPDGAPIAVHAIASELPQGISLLTHFLVRDTMTASTPSMAGLFMLSALGMMLNFRKKR